MSQPLTLRMAQDSLHRPSARRAPWQVGYVRDIGPEELVLLHTISKMPTDVKAPLAKLRDPHHTLAKLLAEGEDPIAVSRVTGYSTQRIRTLIQDPAFAELMNFYAEQKVHRDRDIDMSIRHVAMTATALIQERLEEEPESFSNEELRKLQTASLDRVGFGPQSKKTVEVTDSRGVLNEIRSLMQTENRALIVPRNEVIEGDYTEVLDEPESP